MTLNVFGLNRQNLLYQQMERLEGIRKAWKNFLNFLPQMFFRSTNVALAGNARICTLYASSVWCILDVRINKNMKDKIKQTRLNFVTNLAYNCYKIKQVR